MSEQSRSETDPDKPSVYQIRIKGRLADHWSDWLEGMTITPEADGNTLLSGSVVDDAALYGLLKKLRDMGMPLLAVNRLDSGQAVGSDESR